MWTSSLTSFELYFLIGVYLFTVLLVSALQQCESAISYIRPLPARPPCLPLLSHAGTQERSDICMTSKRLFLTHPTWKPQTINYPCIVTPVNLPNLLAVWKLSCPSYVLRSLFLCTRHLGFSPRDASCLERSPLNAPHPKFVAGTNCVCVGINSIKRGCLTLYNHCRFVFLL